MQPIVVRPVAGASERYEIIAGERRWRAAQRAGLHDVPVTILDVSDREALELAIVENVQRADLNPVEEARGYQALIEEFEYSQATLGETIGKSRVHVTNTLRLLKLPRVGACACWKTGRSRPGMAARCSLRPIPEALAKIVVQKNLSVRETERLAQQPDAIAAAEDRSGRSRRRTPMSSRSRRSCPIVLGMKVEINDEGEGRGERDDALSQPRAARLICRKIRK